MEREYKAYAEIVDDMWNYLRHEKGLAEPENYLCLPLRYDEDIKVIFLGLLL